LEINQFALLVVPSSSQCRCCTVAVMILAMAAPRLSVTVLSWADRDGLARVVANALELPRPRLKSRQARSGRFSGGTCSAATLSSGASPKGAQLFLGSRVLAAKGGRSPTNRVEGRGMAHERALHACKGPLCPRRIAGAVRCHSAAQSLRTYPSLARSPPQLPRLQRHIVWP
jgi:hypothetical protein